MFELLRIFWSFFVIGAVTFGGGYSMLPMLTRECVEKHQWTTKEDLLDFFALAQPLPGLNAVNTAAFIGYQRRRFPGVLAATLGVVAPSIIVIILIAMVLEQAMQYEIVQHAFAGVRIAVGALILGTVMGLAKTSVRSIPHLILCVAALVASFLFNPAWIVLAAAVIGLLMRERVDSPKLKSLFKKRGGDVR